MNKKAQIATVIAVLLGIFLIVITAIKFDWVGMIVRGDKIINFGNNTEIEKPESNDNNNEINDENDVNNDNTSIVNLICIKNNDTTDLKSSITYNYIFSSSELLSSEANVFASYTLPETQTNFAAFIKSYSDLVVLYANNPMVTASENLETNNYTYNEKVDYTVESTNQNSTNLPFTRKSTVSEVTNYYQTLGYICTQS